MDLLTGLIVPHTYFSIDLEPEILKIETSFGDIELIFIITSENNINFRICQKSPDKKGNYWIFYRYCQANNDCGKSSGVGYDNRA